MRSQPPFFTPMVYEYFSETQDIKFVAQMMPYMVKELDWWHSNRTIPFKVGNKTYSVYRFDTPSNTPRPEMYQQDLNLGNQLNDNSKSLCFSFWIIVTILVALSEAKAKLYQDIASAAESGMDFGSRFFGDQKSMISIKTTDILPVDLNAVLCWANDIMYMFNVELGKSRNSFASDRGTREIPF